MPIYEYDCLDCGGRFEALVLGSPDEATACPACGSADLKKAFSVFASPKPGAGGPAPAPA
jgi:putative FmdB family regulatory protein